MSSEALNKSLAKAAAAAGYAMAPSEEDLSDWAVLQPEIALRNGHKLAAFAGRRVVLPFARLEQLIEQVFHLPEFGRTHTPRMLLPSR
jgi:hypothetical protein